ncbi:glutathione S-transferase [Mycena pura]|uniref:Glutathione S-transferase n=1 Tax=Mycena pura TaxID=153505 RepID=A0AAD6VJY5_9AGAR|nr:glutathione S-transferase [Mycena pura]
MTSTVSKAARRLRSISCTFNPSFRFSTMSTKPIMLYTAGTPNGRKVSILLEELKAAYGLEYEWQKIDLSKNEQKEPWFIALNPNGRIPAIVDRARDNFAVFETGSILLYLQQYYDKEGRFSFDPVKQPNENSEVLQWMFWTNAGLWTSIAGHFLNAAPENIPYAQKRYIDETRRLFGVMEIRLKDHEWLVGDKISIADINAYTWTAGHKRCGVDSIDEWPGLKKWLDRIAARETVKVGSLVP